PDRRPRRGAHAVRGSARLRGVRAPPRRMGQGEGRIARAALRGGRVPLPAARRGRLDGGSGRADLRAGSMAAPRVSTLESLRRSFGSWRVGAVVLQSFSSGLPLGLVWIALPAWLKYRGVDIKTIGLFTLAQAPWTFKFLWAPLMDRYRLPF